MATIDALGIAAGGLANTNRAIGVLSHNIANANTPGYVRQVSNQTAATAAGLSLGVASAPATREIDAALQSRLLAQNATADGAALTAQSLAQLDAAHGTPGAGTDLPALLANLETAFSTLQSDPSSATQQARTVAQADTLARQVNSLAATVGTLRQDAQDSIVAGIASLNSALARIGELNRQIVQLKAAGAGTADLETARDAAAAEASSQVALQATIRPNGEMALFTTSGLQLSTDPSAPALSAAAATLGPSSTYPGAAPAIMLGGLDVTAQFATGRLGGALTLRDSTLPGFQAELDEFAETLATRFDEQGLRLFSDPSGAVPASSGIPRQAGYIGFANTIQVNPAVAADPSLMRDGTAAIAGTPGGPTAFTPNPAGGPAGFTALITRVLSYSLGDQLAPGIAQPTPNLSGMGPAGTLASPMRAPGALSAFATALAARQTQAAGDADAASTAAADVRTALTQSIATRSGVDLDTELSTMITLQNAYAANAKVIGALQNMWSQLLQTVQ